MAHDLFDIQGKKALVTGSGSGIGLGMATGLLEAGCTVVLHSHGQNAVKEAERLRGLGYDAKAVTGDLTTEEDCKAVFEAALEQLGGEIDILVNNAGAQFRCAAEDFPVEEFDKVMTINNRAVFILSQLAAKNMIPRGYGKIINTASMQSFFGIPNTPAYAASKGAIMQLTKSLGTAWISKGINVNALAPGWIKTKLTQQVTGNEENARPILDRIPAGRFGEPSDFRGPVVFLASHASDYLAGAIIPVDGGYLVR